LREKQVEEKVEEILQKIEEGKIEEVEEAIIETMGGKDHYHLKAIREKRKEQMRELEKKLEDTREELEDTTKRYKQALKQKEKRIEKLRSIDKLEELTGVEDLDLKEKNLASKSERENVANKLNHLAKKIKNNRYLAKDTLKTFDFYRDKMITRLLKEEELGRQLTNISK
jgi:hypothetical protein